jgi:hypothetical protein
MEIVDTKKTMTNINKSGPAEIRTQNPHPVSRYTTAQANTKRDGQNTVSVTHCLGLFII